MTLTAKSRDLAHFFSLNFNDLHKLLQGLGKETYRTQQIFKWVYQKQVHDVHRMTNLSKSFRCELSKLLSFHLPLMLQSVKSQDGTEKFLIGVGEGRSIETVLIPSKGRLTLCLSSQVGCNMACRFCFTAKQRLLKRLSTAEIVAQYLLASQWLFQQDAKNPDQTSNQKRISNIVFMGMGEPLDNAEAVFKAIEILTSDWGCNLSRRKITVSTSGLIPHIPKVAKSGVRLAVSLNATTEAIRSQIMPINRKYSLADLLVACRQYAQDTRDKVTFEYVLLKDLTDRQEDAQRLRQLTKDIPCKINIIPFNEHPESGFERPSEQRVLDFQKELMRLGCHVLLRKTMGRDIYAACGQLFHTQKKALTAGKHT